DVEDSEEEERRGEGQRPRRKRGESDPLSDDLVEDDRPRVVTELALRHAASEHAGEKRGEEEAHAHEPGAAQRFRKQEPGRETHEAPRGPGSDREEPASETGGDPARRIQRALRAAGTNTARACHAYSRPEITVRRVVKRKAASSGPRVVSPGSR